MLPISKADRDPGLKGIRGWLLFFAIVSLIAVVRDLVLAFGSDSRTEMMYNGIAILLNIYGFYILVTLQRHAPAYWTVMLGLVALLSIVGGELRGVLPSLLWLLYWIRSERVLLTFGSNGFGGKFGIGERLPPVDGIQAAPMPT